MSLGYSKNYCENCKRYNGGACTGFQLFLLVILWLLFIIPGIIYYFVGEPSRCYICGLKKRHRKKVQTKEN